VKTLLSRKTAPKGWQYFTVHAITHDPETASGYDGKVATEMIGAKTGEDTDRWGWNPLRDHTTKTSGGDPDSVERGDRGTGVDGRSMSEGTGRFSHPFNSIFATLGKMRVCTMCTPWASDRVALLPDWAGVPRISGEWPKFKGWNPVRVPPRAQCFLRSGAFLVFFRVDSVHSSRR
jgi:hypothetical protein